MKQILPKLLFFYEPNFSLLLNIPARPAVRTAIAHFYSLNAIEALVLKIIMIHISQLAFCMIIPKKCQIKKMLFDLNLSATWRRTGDESYQ